MTLFCLQMNQLFRKMRELSIREMKSRREEIFQRTRKIMNQEEQAFSDEESYIETEGQSHQNQMKAEQPIAKQYNKKGKKSGRQFKQQRYWRKMLQVSEWMVEIPSDLNEYYVAARPDGSKSLLIFKGFGLQIRDKAGNTIYTGNTSSKTLDGTILQIYFSDKTVIVSDLIVWKCNPMTGSQFQFRYSWLISNLNLPQLHASTKLNFNFLKFLPVTHQNLQQTYQSKDPYQKDGLIFVHKDSFYIHGLNPSVLVWKDEYISKYYLQDRNDNKESSKGVGFLNKNGVVKSLQNVGLFIVDRGMFDVTSRFVRFGYGAIQLLNTEQDKVEVRLSDVVVMESMRYFNGAVDSVSKLLHKRSLKHAAIDIKQLMQHCFELESAMKE